MDLVRLVELGGVGGPDDVGGLAGVDAQRGDGGEAGDEAAHVGVAVIGVALQPRSVNSSRAVRGGMRAAARSTSAISRRRCGVALMRRRGQRLPR
jgi:hypothetical protein